MRVIDAHQHFWTLASPWHRWPTPDLPAIHRDFAPGDLAPALDRLGIDGTILVQSQPSDADTDWMLSLASRTPHVLGVVGWVDLVAPEAPDRIAALAAHPALKGVRPMLQDLPADWVLQSAAVPALEAIAAHGLAFDALVRPVHLPAIRKLAVRHPGLSIVVDHAGKPDIAGAAWQPWADDMARLAEHASVACKLSGLLTEAGPGWAPADLAPCAGHVLAAFGGDRVMWGSDWPVVTLCASYDQWWAAAQALVPAADRAAVFGGTAARIYRLG